jgi:hypothetical protein
MSTCYCCYYNIHLMNKRSSYIRDFFKALLNVLRLSENFLMLKGRLKNLLLLLIK